MTREEFDREADRVAAARDFGIPSAAKRGRRTEWPYVPVIQYPTYTAQVRGKAFATRDEAIAYATTCIERGRRQYRANLALRGCRAMREASGLPREVPQD